MGLEAKKSRVLIVDDEKAVLGFMTIDLTAEEYEVQTATNDQEGLRCILSTKPDILITDNRMPNPRQGIKMIEKIPNELSHKMAIIVMSAGDDGVGMDVRRLQEQGLSIAFLPKPFDEDKLIGLMLELEREVEDRKNNHTSSAL